ncbi:hypothetical protein GW932_00170 [archaeon]|nr:hypothetical protein [archaeon]
MKKLNEKNKIGDFSTKIFDGIKVLVQLIEIIEGSEIYFRNDNQKYRIKFHEHKSSTHQWLEEDYESITEATLEIKILIASCEEDVMELRESVKKIINKK